MTYNTLKLEQQLDFVEFLKNHDYPDGTSIKIIADEATRALGFVVTENNVKTTARAAKIELPAARVPKVDPMDELRANIIALEQRVIALESANRVTSTGYIKPMPSDPGAFGVGKAFGLENAAG